MSLPNGSSATGEQVWEDGGVPVCTAPGNQGGPFVIADGSGGAFVVWSDYRNDPNIFSSADLYAQRIDANGNALWEKDGINFCNDPSNQQQPEGISDDKGGLIVTWWDDRDIFADIYAQRITPDGIPMWQDNGNSHLYSSRCATRTPPRFGWFTRRDYLLERFSRGLWERYRRCDLCPTG